MTNGVNSENTQGNDTKKRKSVEVITVVINGGKEKLEIEASSKAPVLKEPEVSFPIQVEEITSINQMPTKALDEIVEKASKLKAYKDADLEEITKVLKTRRNRNTGRSI